MSRNRVLNLKAVPASLFGGSQSFFFQYLEIVHHYIFAETAPATVNSLRAKVGDQTPIARSPALKLRYFLAYGHYNSCILVSQSQRISIYSGKMSRNQFAVSRIAQCHHFCFHQRLISLMTGVSTSRISILPGAGTITDFIVFLFIFICYSSVFAISVYIPHKA